MGFPTNLGTMPYQMANHQNPQYSRFSRSDAVDCIRSSVLVGLCVAAIDASFTLCVLRNDARFDGTYVVDAWSTLLSHAMLGAAIGALGAAIGLAAASARRPRIVALGKALAPAVWSYVISLGFIASYGYAMVGTTAEVDGAGTKTFGFSVMLGLFVGLRRYRRALESCEDGERSNHAMRTTVLVVTAALATTGLLSNGQDRDAFIERSMAGLDAQHALNDNRPNILFITIDTLRADHLGPYGYTNIATPALDRLASNGVVFEQMTAQSSWTRSSFGSMWTSRTPSYHGANWKLKRATRWDNRNDTVFSDGLHPDLPTMAQVLAESGYRTVGINTNIQTAVMFGFNKGFDNYIDYSRPVSITGRSLLCHGMRAHYHDACDLLTSKDEAYEYQPGDLVLGTALKTAEKLSKSGGPFFLWVHFMDVHGPYKPHTSDREAVDYGDIEGWLSGDDPDLDWARERMIEAYDEEIAYTDVNIGKLISYFDSTEGLTDTFIAVTSDHGEEMVERWKPQSVRDEGSYFYYRGYGHGHTMYDDQLRVPLIVRLPDNSFSGKRIPWVAQHIDLLPTFAAVAGVDVTSRDEEFEGTNLLAYLEADVAPEERRVKSEMNCYGPEVKSLRSRMDKLVLRVKDGSEEFYDLLADPGETTNAIKTHFTTAAVVRDWLDVWLASIPEMPTGDAEVDEHPHTDDVEERLKALGYLH
jgi:arylsulfatase